MSTPHVVFLACEPGERLLDAFVRILEHLRAGAGAVVVLDAKDAVAHIWHAKNGPATLFRGDTLELPDLLPGLSVPVARFFA